MFRKHAPLHGAPAPRSGFSLIEVMVSVVVLAVATSAVIGSMSNLNGLRRATEDDRAGERAANFVVQAILGANWDDLNDTTKDGAFLTWVRLPGANIEADTNCLTDTGATGTNRLPFTTGLDDLRIYVEYYRAVTALDENSLVMMSGSDYCFSGLLQGTLKRSSGPSGEVWQIDPTGGDPTRAQHALTGFALTERVGSTAFRIPSIGIMQADATGDGANDSIAAIRLPSNATVASQAGVLIGANDPVAIRVTASWKDRASKPGPGQARRQFTIITGVKR